MRCFRLCQRRHARSAFDGEGARRYAGRWHHAGTPVVYTASSLSLAALELLVHFDPDLAPDDFVSIAVDVPPALRTRRLPAAKLPRNWRRIPAPDETRDLGSAWAREQKSVALVVPSVVIPDEANVLLSPRHPDFRKLRIHPPKRFSFDLRLVR